MKIPALVLFVLMYVLMIAKPKYRPCYALVTAAIFLVSGILPFGSLAETINWNVLLMIAGTMIIVYYFIDSRMPNLLADLLLGKSKNVMWVTILMSLFAGLISAFIQTPTTSPPLPWPLTPLVYSEHTQTTTIFHMNDR